MLAPAYPAFFMRTQLGPLQKRQGPELRQEKPPTSEDYAVPEKTTKREIVSRHGNELREAVPGSAGDSLSIPVTNDHHGL